jgi:poly(A) polymerase
VHWNESSPMIQSARRITERLRSAGHTAYWVGGCVRDALLGIGAKDIDIATSAAPEQVQELFPRNVSVGAQFGVILVLDGDVQTEVATFRSDGAYVDARHPTSVTFSSPRHDAERRDFTINALFYDPATDDLHDFVAGRADLEAGVLRAIGEPRKRFEEDALRLLRAIRFAVRFNFEIEPMTKQALFDQAQRIRLISAERVRDELVRIFTGPRPGAALRLLNDSGLLEVVLPEVAALDAVPQPPKFHPEGDVLIHTCLALDALGPSPSPTLAFATLLHDIGKPPTIEHADRIRFNLHQEVGAEMADAVCHRLRFSTAERKQIVALVGNHMKFMHVQNMRRARLRRLLALDRFGEHLALHRADCLSSHGNIDNYDYCNAMLAEFEREDSEPVLPPPLLTGNDLIAAGYAPGPRMGRILAEAGEAQLEGEFKTAEEAIDWVRERHAPDQDCP